MDDAMTVRLPRLSADERDNMPNPDFIITRVGPGQESIEAQIERYGVTFPIPTSDRLWYLVSSRYIVEIWQSVYVERYAQTERHTSLYSKV